MRGRRVDEATRLSLLTPEERAERQRLQEEHDRQYAEMQARRRAEIDAQFTDAYMTYRAENRYDMAWVNDSPVRGVHYNLFFDPLHSSPVTPQPTETSLHERFNAAVIEADRCARRGDTLGRVAATRMANDLRRQILQQDLSTI